MVLCYNEFAWWERPYAKKDVLSFFQTNACLDGHVNLLDTVWKEFGRTNYIKKER